MPNQLPRAKQPLRLKTVHLSQTCGPAKTRHWAMGVREKHSGERRWREREESSNSQNGEEVLQFLIPQPILISRCHSLRRKISPSLSLPFYSRKANLHGFSLWSQRIPPEAIKCSRRKMLPPRPTHKLMVVRTANARSGMLQGEQAPPRCFEVQGLWCCYARGAVDGLLGSPLVM